MSVDLWVCLSVRSHITTRNSWRDEITNANFFTTTSSSTFAKCTREATEFGEITQFIAIMPFNVIQDHWFWYRKLIILYDFLLVMNTNLPPISCTVSDIWLSVGPKSPYLATPLAFTAPTGVPWDDLRKIFRAYQWMAKVANGIETLPKISTGWVGCTRVTNRRQTDGRQHIASMNAVTFAIKAIIMSKLREIFGYLWPRLGLPLTVMQHVM